MGFSSQIKPDIEKDRLTLVFGVRYETADETILESVYQFVFEVMDLSSLSYTMIIKALQ